MIAIKYASDELREDIEFIKELMQYNGLGLQFLSADMRSNNIIQNIISAAVDSCELASIFVL